MAPPPRKKSVKDKSLAELSVLCKSLQERIDKLEHQLNAIDVNYVETNRRLNELMSKRNLFFSS